MKRRDEGRTSLVEFLRSIKFSTRSKKSRAPEPESNTRFAELHPHARQPQGTTAEDESLIRSGN